MEIKKTRIIDIAAKAGVSIGTVDRVIHNRGRVNPETKELILRLLQESNYQPNLVARALTSKIETVIAVLMPSDESGNSFWKLPLLGIERAAAEIQQFNVRVESFFFAQYDEADFEQKINQMLALQPNAVVIVPVFKSIVENAISELVATNIPYIFFNIDFKDDNRIGFVGSDSFAEGKIAAQIMLYGIRTSGTVLVINSVGSTDLFPHLYLRNQGFSSVIKSSSVTHYLKLEIKYINNDTSLSIEESIANTSDIVGIYVTDSKAYKIASYLERTNHNDIVLIGNDLTQLNIPFLENRTIDFLISQRPEQQGYLSVISIYNYLNNLAYQKGSVLMPIDIFTKDNYRFSMP